MLSSLRFPLLIVGLLAACAEGSGGQGPAGPEGPTGPQGATGAQGPAGVCAATEVIQNGTQPQVASFNITGSATVGGPLIVGETLHATSTWGLNARTQGLMIMPEGPVYDDGAGNVTFGQTVIVMNPAAGSWVRVAAGTYALASWSYLYIDLPPFAIARAALVPQVGTWSDADRAYDHPDRLILAQRQAGGAVYFNFHVPAPTLAPPQSLLTMIGPNLGDQRLNSTVAPALTWWTPPNRTLAFVKHYAQSKLRITYQDTLGTYGQYYAGCEWQITLDGAQVAFFSDGDIDQQPPISWKMTNAAHIAWATATTGPHTIVVQNRGNRGAWGGGTSECLQGWNTVGNFLSVEEVP